MNVALDLVAIRQNLAVLFGVEPGDVGVRRQPGGKPHEVQVLATPAGFTLVLICISTSDPGRILMAWSRARERAHAVAKTAVPVMVVPFMGPGGRVCCEREEIGWIDLCGNACVSGPGLRLFVADQPNRFARRGRPRTVFAPRSSHVVKWLMETSGAFISQRALSKFSEVNEGSTSRVVRKLEEDGFLGRAADGKVCVLDTNVLLQALDHAGSFSKNHILYGHTPTGGGAKLLRDVVGLLKAHSVEYAATGLAGAWAWEALDDFRLVTLYLRESPTPELLDTLQAKHQVSFHDAQADADANVWLVIPRDDGVFQIAPERKGVRTAGRLQVYLDLAAHRESANSAREILRPQIIHPPREWSDFLNDHFVRLHSGELDFWKALLDQRVGKPGQSDTASGAAIASRTTRSQKRTC